MSTYEKYPHPIDVRNHLLEIRVKSSLYLESGCLDPHSIAPLNDQSYRPSTLHFSPDLTTLYNSAEPLIGKLKFFKDPDSDLTHRGETTIRTNTFSYDPKDEGSTETTSFGCDPDTLSNNIVISGESFSDGPYCQGSKAFYKVCGNSMPGCNYGGGKMQLFLQAIHGQKEDADWRFSDPVFWFLGLVIRDQYMGSPYAYEGSVGVYKADNGRYYLMNFSDTFGFIVKAMIPSASADALRVWLNDNPQDADTTRRLEAYILATCTFEENWWQIKTPAQLGDLFQLGAPFAYGLHFNNDGNEARAACIDRYDEATYPDSNPRWQSNYFKVLVDMVDPGPNRSIEERATWHRYPENWTCNVQNLETTIFTGKPSVNWVWSPSPATGGSVAWVPKGFTGDDIEYDDALWYVAYDSVNDDWVEVRMTQEVFPMGYYFVNQADPDWPCGADPDQCSERADVFTGSLERDTLSVSGGYRYETYDGYLRVNARWGLLNKDRAAIGAWQIGDNSLWPIEIRCEAGFPPADRDAHRHSFQSYNCTSISATFISSGDTLLAFPFRASNAFYAGRLTTWFDSSPNINYFKQGCRLHHQEIEHGKPFPNPTETSGWIEGHLSWTNAGFVQQLYVYKASLNSGCLWTYTDPFTLDEIDIDLFIGDMSQPIDCTNDSAATNVGGPGVFVWPHCSQMGAMADLHADDAVLEDDNWYLWFNTLLLIDPLIEEVLIAKHDLTGNYNAYRDPNAVAGQVKDDNFPYDEMDSSAIVYVGHT